MNVKSIPGFYFPKLKQNILEVNQQRWKDRTEEKLSVELKEKEGSNSGKCWKLEVSVTGIFILFLFLTIKIKKFSLAQLKLLERT